MKFFIGFVCGVSLTVTTFAVAIQQSRGTFDELQMGAKAKSVLVIVYNPDARYAWQYSSCAKGKAICIRNEARYRDLAGKLADLTDITKDSPRED